MIKKKELNCEKTGNMSLFSATFNEHLTSDFLPGKKRKNVIMSFECRGTFFDKIFSLSDLNWTVNKGFLFKVVSQLYHGKIFKLFQSKWEKNWPDCF